MTCKFCNHAVSALSQKENAATICHACRESRAPIPVALVRLENGDVHFSLYPDGEVDGELEKVVQVIPAQLPKSDAARLWDLHHRAYVKEENGAALLLSVITDTLPSMIAKTLAA